MIDLKPGERLDDLQCGGYRLIQRPGGFCFGTDAVLLADFAAPRRNERAADLGCGNGVLSVLMAAHRRDITVEAVEIQAEVADMADRSVRLNGLEDRVRVYNVDMRDAHRAIGSGGMSLVVCNPPYNRSSDPAARDGSARIARQMDDLSVDDVALSASRLLKYGGRFCAVYPAPRAFEMMTAMQNAGLAPKRIQTVHARADRAPKLILIEAVKGGGSMLKWLEPLILYDADGSHSAQWHRIYDQSDTETTTKINENRKDKGDKEG